MQLPERMSILSSNLESKGRSNFFCSMRVMAGELHSCNEGCRRGRRSRRGGSRRSPKKGGFRMPKAFPEEFPNISPGTLREYGLKGRKRLIQGVEFGIRQEGIPFRRAA